MTDRVREILDMNLVDAYVPLIVESEHASVYPMYNARLIGEKSIAFPVTDATGIDETLAQPRRALAMVVDRRGGYEAYVLEGTARLVTDDQDYGLVAEMRTVAEGFPIHDAVLFEVQNVHLAPPP